MRTQEEYYQEFVDGINSKTAFVNLMYKALTMNEDWPTEKKLAAAEYVDNNMGFWVPEAL